jgi:hypothetical protein
MSCKGIIYHTLKSKLDNTSCPNKAKDVNGFCLQHKKQSLAYERNRQIQQEVYGFIEVNFKVYFGDEYTYIKMRNNRPMSSILTPLYDKYQCFGYFLFHNNTTVDLSLPGELFDGMVLYLNSGP